MKAAAHIRPPSSQHGPETAGNLGDTQSCPRSGQQASGASWAVPTLTTLRCAAAEQRNHRYLCSLFSGHLQVLPLGNDPAHADMYVCSLLLFLLAFNFNTTTQTAFQGLVIMCLHVNMYLTTSLVTGI